MFKLSAVVGENKQKLIELFISAEEDTELAPIGANIEGGESTHPLEKDVYN